MGVQARIELRCRHCGVEIPFVVPPVVATPADLTHAIEAAADEHARVCKLLPAEATSEASP